MRRESGLAIGEVAGRDSAAAIIKVASFDSVSAVLPTLVYTATEYGSWTTAFENIKRLKGQIEKGYKKRFYDTIILGDAELWWALNGRFLSVLLDRFGFYSPCLGCHLYMHLVRVPLAKELNCTKIISGEKIKHDRRIKINQTGIVLDAYRKILDYSGIELLFPIRDLSCGSDIVALVGDNWAEGEKQLRCVFSGNYRRLDNEVVYEESKIKKYLDEYIIPVGKGVLGAWEMKEKADYEELVRSVLAGNA